MVGQWGLSSSEVLSSRGGCQVSHRISPQNPRGTLVPLRCCILYQCPRGSSLGAPLTGTLGRSILPHILPQQSRLPWKGSQEAASEEEAWGHGATRDGWAGGAGRGQGHSSRQLPRRAGSTPVCRDQSCSHGKGGGHCSSCPTHPPRYSEGGRGAENLSSPPLVLVLRGER